MATFTNQQSRLLTLTTPLGEDVLLLTGFTGQEAISRLFSYQLEMVSEEEDIKPQDIVGKNVSWAVQEVDKEPRWFNGHVSRFAAGSARHHDRRVYRMEVVPYLWFLTRTANCRIFQNKKTPQIIEAIFGDYGLTDFEPQLKRSYPEWEYCVQYRETAFQFVARLAEHEGIFWFFRHEEGKHTLVLADHKGAYKELPESPVDYLAGTLAPNHIDSWEHQYEFRPGKWAHTDYNFKTPSTSLLVNTKTVMDLPGVDKFEIFDYPGEYPAKADGEADVKVRMEEEEAAHDVVTASSSCPTFTPGSKFTIGSHEIESEVGKGYVLTSIQHAATDTSQGQSGGAADYHNTFTCIPADVVFRPRRLTPKSIVRGPQTAVVVGPKGEEIYTDQYGRVKVQFFWDREGKKDENSSCWMRVSQEYAGKGWGSVCIPRIGQEVVVDFLEGDPDRPLITGRVYNAEQTVPYGLPGKKMVSGLKSNSTPGGGGYNEFIMDDTKGNELIREHGQFDKDSTIEHDLREHVLNDRFRDVTKNETIQIGVDRTRTVGNNESITIGNNRTRNVSGNEAVTVTMMRTHTVGINEAITVGGAQEVTVGGFRMVSVGAYQMVTVGGYQTITVGASQSVNVGGSYTLKVAKKLTENIVGDSGVTVGGKHTEQIAKDFSSSVGGAMMVSVTKNTLINVGKEFQVEAADKIVLTTGDASITLKKDGTIILKGKDIQLTGSGKINVKADGNITMKGSKIGQN